jgi:Na+/melibiose symporter-like transporter
LAGGAKLVYAYITYSSLMFIYTAVNIPYSALMGVITPNSQERTSISSIRFIGAFHRRNLSCSTSPSAGQVSRAVAARLAAGN